MLMLFLFNFEENQLYLLWVNISYLPTVATISLAFTEMYNSLESLVQKTIYLLANLFVCLLVGKLAMD